MKSMKFKATTKLLPPIEVCRLFGMSLNPIQVADMERKRLVEAKVRSVGQGSARLFDKEGVFYVGIAAALRGILSLHSTEKVMEHIKESIDSSDDWDVLVIRYSKRRGEQEFETLRFEDITGDLFKGNPGMTNPDDYRTIILNVRGLRDYVDGVV